MHHWNSVFKHHFFRGITLSFKLLVPLNNIYTYIYAHIYVISQARFCTGALKLDYYVHLLILLTYIVWRLEVFFWSVSLMLLRNILAAANLCLCLDAKRNYSNIKNVKYTYVKYIYISPYVLSDWVNTQNIWQSFATWPLTWVALSWTLFIRNNQLLKYFVLKYILRAMFNFSLSNRRRPYKNV